MTGDRGSPSDSPRDATRQRDERLRELGQISGELLHDLAGLFTVLSSRVSLAREGALLGRVPADELGRIQQDTDEIRRMVSELLAELRDAPRSPELSFSVVSSIEATIDRWLLSAPSLTTTLDAEGAAQLQVVGPRTFFTRSLGNLLRNAARHARSEIRIEVLEDSDTSSVQIMVEDDGDGVPEAWRESLFRPFVSGAGGGAGLGLSFARWGIGRLGGKIELEAGSGELGGAAFRITLPLGWRGETAPSPSLTRPATSSMEHGRMRALRLQHPLRGLRVAIVDDDAAVRDVFCRLINRSGAEAVEVVPDSWASTADGKAALDHVAPDVILLDIGLGDISGNALLRHLEDEMSPLVERVIFLTGGLEPEAGMNRPVLNKLDEWSEVASQIRAVGDGEIFSGDSPPATG